MPGQQVSQNLSEFLTYLQERLRTLELKVDGIAPANGGLVVSGGALEMKGNDINEAGDLSGETYSRDVDDIVSNTGGSVSGNLPMFSGTTGKVITDSAITSASVVEDGLNIGMALNQTYPIAPAGQRDLWQGATGATSSTMKRVGPSGYVYNTHTIIKRSADGGVTFAPVVYDIASTTNADIAYGNGTYVTVGNLESYTSVDGINFSKNVGFTYNSYEVHFFAAAGLFIAWADVSPTQQLITSPDGITWTPRTATVDAYSFRSNSTTCVFVSSGTAPYAMYSTNGTTWTNTPSVIGPARIVGWSEEKKEWLILGHGTGLGWRSLDGITWTALGSVAPTNASQNSLNWVATYGRWYCGGQDSDGNYSLFSTYDATLPFLGTHLDGAVNAGLNLHSLYLADYNRFLVGCATSPNVFYSTARNDLKVLSDNIRVRNMPATCARFSTSADTAVDNTTTETSLVAPATFLGTLALQDSQPLGMVIKLEINLKATSAAGDTFTVRINVNGATHITHAIVIPGAAANLPVRINATFTVYATTIQAYSVRLLSAAVPEIVTASTAYTRTVINTFSITGQWGAALSTCAVGHIDAVVLYPNGA